MAFQLKIKPIIRWIGAATKHPQSSRFKQTYSNTKKILESELDKLGAVASTIHLEMFIKPEDLRIDGELRANVKPYRDGVVLSFSRISSRTFDEQTRQWNNNLLSLSYPCDAFDYWRDNLRAVALSLEALRKVARYGVFKYEDMVSRLALPSAEGKISDRDSALQFIAAHSRRKMEQLTETPFLKSAYLEAAMKLHPDKGGKVDDFHRLQKAKEILGL